MNADLLWNKRLGLIFLTQHKSAVCLLKIYNAMTQLYHCQSQIIFDAFELSLCGLEILRTLLLNALGGV